MSLDNEFYKFETTSSKISQSTVQNVTAGYIETLKQFIILINSFWVWPLGILLKHLCKEKSGAWGRRCWFEWLK